MSIDLINEVVYSFAKATQFVPPGRNGRKSHISTLLRWATKGAKAPDGTIVRLEAKRLGGRWVTSREAILRFMAALTPQMDGEADVHNVRTARSRRRGDEQAAKELDRLGI
jgi:hypothetical protein